MTRHADALAYATHLENTGSLGAIHCAKVIRRSVWVHRLTAVLWWGAAILILALLGLTVYIIVGTV